MAILMVGLVVTLYVALGGIWAQLLDLTSSWLALPVSSSFPFILYLVWLPDASQLPATLCRSFGTLPVINSLFFCAHLSVITVTLKSGSLLDHVPQTRI